MICNVRAWQIHRHQLTQHSDHLSFKIRLAGTSAMGVCTMEIWSHLYRSPKLALNEVGHLQQPCCCDLSKDASTMSQPAQFQPHHRPPHRPFSSQAACTKLRILRAITFVDLLTCRVLSSVSMQGSIGCLQNLPQKRLSLSAQNIMSTFFHQSYRISLPESKESCCRAV